MSKDSGVVDITELTQMIKSAWISANVTALVAAIGAVPGLGWLTVTPFFSNAITWLVEWAISKMADFVYNQAFFLATSIRKAGQAQDFISAVHKLNSLPEDISDEEYEKYERIRMAEFNNLVHLAS